MTASPASHPNLLHSLPSRSWIATVRLRSLGDVLLTTPALAILKQWRPDLRIAYLVSPRFAGALYANPDIDEIIPVGDGLRQRIEALRKLRRLKPRVALNLHGGSTASWLTAASGAPTRVHFLGTRNDWAHNVHVPPVPPPPDRPRWHTAEHVASMLRFIGMPERALGPLRLTVSPTARLNLNRKLERLGAPGPFAFIHAQPRSFTMRWGLKQYHQFLPWLHRQFGLTALFARASSQPGFEEEIISALPLGSAALLVGTTVEELAAAVERSALVFGSDGGPIHIAAALQRPVVALYGGTDSVVWAPWQTRSRIVQNPFPCNPCRADRCYAFESPRCIESITVEQAQAAVVELMGASVKPALS